MVQVVFLLFGVVAVSAIPFQDELTYLALENPDLFEGDIVGIDPGDRNVVPEDRKRWPGRTIPYVIHEDLEDETENILKAMEEYHNKTCIRFKKREKEENYIWIMQLKGCYSHVGMKPIGYGWQVVSLGFGCEDVGTIVHELGHVVGLFHEQNRSDRDKHLIIHWDNIKNGSKSQFNLLKPDQNILYVPFDYNSIMIYGNYAFSADRISRKKTMEAVDGTVLTEPSKKPGLAPSDVIRINKMYNC